MTVDFLFSFKQEERRREEERGGREERGGESIRGEERGGEIKEIKESNQQKLN